MAPRMFLAIVIVGISLSNALPLLHSEETQGIICAITKLENALNELPYVELQPCSPVSYVTSFIEYLCS